MLNLDRLRTLNAVARHGSVSAAADGLHVTTSAVSQQLAKLERETGQQLLAKQGRGVRLTDAGKLLAEHASRILSQVELAQADLEAQRGRAVGELVLGAFPTAARGLAPAVLASLRASQPQLRVRLEEMDPEHSLPRVVRGDMDLAVVLEWRNHPLPIAEGLARASVLDDPVDVAVSAGHPLAAREAVDLEDLAEEEWISWPHGQFCHEWLMSTLRSKGIEPRTSHMADEHHTQLALVAAGLGVVVAPRLGRGPVPEGVRILPVRHTMHRHVYAVWRADADRRPSIRAAVGALQAAGKAVSGASS
ncbi:MULTISPECIES: LysR family transcriptional regulator [Streptomyces]|uniref:LysR family transcriptional regulator n=1 Tax=Streptomyces morookaense TaxID=1970 RepID=A0A7Y7B9N4_STRMO|nr:MULTISPECIES: LysR family transcriptional regulator [Streptomyces]MCC2280696.1 LysR family transcriptional regulator [Streptomyces sp. ET3-23]NVK81590.1 LysR family transcriptional regulator [Streptomyces morookaense]GHF03502.1 LysR family transcriptional regulator [Streptomyces morookaense]